MHLEKLSLNQNERPNHVSKRELEHLNDRDLHLHSRARARGCLELVHILNETKTRKSEFLMIISRMHTSGTAWYIFLHAHAYADLEFELIVHVHVIMIFNI